MILAPVARERKGEFSELFEQMQAQGYVRFRVDGRTVESGELPALKKAEKHDIDVVIDRLKVRPEVTSRLADSFEAALRLADGRAIALEMDSAAVAGPSQDGGAPPRGADAQRPGANTFGQEHLFNSKFACPVCSYSIPEWSRACFPSTRRPAPASCDGLGTTEVFDAERVVAFPSLSWPAAIKAGPAQQLLLRVDQPGQPLQIRCRDPC